MLVMTNLLRCMMKTLGLQVGHKLLNEFGGTRQPGARWGLSVLSAINLLNFADRYVPSAVKTLIVEDLHLTDFQSALPSTGMVIVYMIFAVIFGTISDRNIYDRRFILAGAIVFWSLATGLAGLSTNLVQLIAIRSLVGVGEAAYGTIAPPMISDYFPDSERNVAYGVYYLAIPVGGALGFGIGALFGSWLGWRAAFLIIGLPGILVAVTVLQINNPYFGVHENNDHKDIHGARQEGEDGDEGEDSERLKSVEIKSLDQVPLKPRSSSCVATIVPAASAPIDWRAELSKSAGEYRQIMTNPHFLFALLGQCANNFALGGLSDWYATFLLRYAPDADLSMAGLVVGAATVVGGIIGVMLGNKIADYCKDRGWKSAYFLIPALFTIPASIFLLLCINITSSFALMSALLIIGEVFVWTCVSPISAISISVIPPKLRARSCGVLIFAQHILGDVISPPIIGKISDDYNSLQLALQMCWIGIAVSGFWWFCGYYFLSNVDSIKFGEDPEPRNLLSEQSSLNNPIVKGSHMSAMEDAAGDATARAGADTRVMPQQSPNFLELLCGEDPLGVDPVTGHSIINPKYVPR